MTCDFDEHYSQEGLLTLHKLWWWLACKLINLEKEHQYIHQDVSYSTHLIRHRHTAFSSWRFEQMLTNNSIMWHYKEIARGNMLEKKLHQNRKKKKRREANKCKEDKENWQYDTNVIHWDWRWKTTISKEQSMEMMIWEQVRELFNWGDCDGTSLHIWAGSWKNSCHHPY